MTLQSFGNVTKRSKNKTKDKVIFFMNNFTKKDLKIGMIVETRCNILYMVHEFNNELVFINTHGWLKLTDYEEDLLLHDRELKRLDVINVREPNEMYQLVNGYWHQVPVIWERKELPKLTDDEHAILENLDLNIFYPWIARDKDGRLFLHKERPEKDKGEGVWSSQDQIFFLPYSKLFQFIKWTDTEVYSIHNLIEPKQNERQGDSHE